jgi:chromosome segregation ATPase
MLTGGNLPPRGLLARAFGIDPEDEADAPKDLFQADFKVGVLKARLRRHHNNSVLSGHNPRMIPGHEKDADEKDWTQLKNGFYFAMGSGNNYYNSLLSTTAVSHMLIAEAMERETKRLQESRTKALTSLALVESGIYAATTSLQNSKVLIERLAPEMETLEEKVAKLEEDLEEARQKQKSTDKILRKLEKLHDRIEERKSEAEENVMTDAKGRVVHWSHTRKCFFFRDEDGRSRVYTAAEQKLIQTSLTARRFMSRIGAKFVQRRYTATEIEAMGKEHDHIETEMESTRENREEILFVVAEKEKSFEKVSARYDEIKGLLDAETEKVKSHEARLHQLKCDKHSCRTEVHSIDNRIEQLNAYRRMYENPETLAALKSGKLTIAEMVRNMPASLRQGYEMLQKKELTATLAPIFD